MFKTESIFIKNEKNEQPTKNIVHPEGSGSTMFKPISSLLLG
jgi:hypothetical protein